MGQVYVRASRRAKAYTRRQQQAITAFTPANRKPTSVLRALKSANKFISRRFSSVFRERAKIDRDHIRKALEIKLVRGGRKSAYR